jgi:hypothetical protein
MPKAEKEYWLSVVVNVRIKASSSDEAWRELWDSLPNGANTSNELTVGIYDVKTGKEIDED